MIYSFETFPEKENYQSMLVINKEAMWRETLYFTYFTPWGEKSERLYSGRAMSDFHFKNKPVECVVIFDFHKWDGDTIDEALKRETPPVVFKAELREYLEKALQHRENTGSDGFNLKIKD